MTISIATIDALRSSPRRAASRARRVMLASCLLLAALVLALPTPARADLLPSRPITLWGDRLVIGGDVSISFGSDDRGYFNTLDYDHNALNLARIGLSAEFRPTDRVAIVSQIVDQAALRSEPFDVRRNVLRLYALFVRVRPWRDKPFDIQAGRIPPVFGAFLRQDYGAGNPLIGLPLAYHYPTTMRADALPASADDLLRQRGRGWYVWLPITAGGGGGYNAQGLSIISPTRWDTGVQARWGDGPIEVSGAITSGTLSNPRVEDDNGGKQISGRIGFKPAAGLSVGLSGARGAFLADRVIAAVPARVPPVDVGGPFTQRAFGADAEFARGYWQLRAETIVSLWRVPAIDAPRLDHALRAWASSLEARWKFAPRWYLAARLDTMTFSRVTGTAEELPLNGVAEGPYGAADDAPPVLRESWDAPLGRIEVGGGYTITRNVRAKASYQYDWRDTTRRNRANLVSAQLVYWF